MFAQVISLGFEISTLRAWPADISAVANHLAPVSDDLPAPKTSDLAPGRSGQIDRFDRHTNLLDPEKTLPACGSRP